MRCSQNVLNIKQAKFHELLVQQLLSPISVFQVFCSLLWLLDAYWQYCVFTVLSIGMLESTSAFQRLKTLGTLQGMSSKSYFIKVYRFGKWHDMSTEDILPGDLISLRGKPAMPKTIVPVAKPGDPPPPKPGEPGYKGEPPLPVSCTRYVHGVSYRQGCVSTKPRSRRGSRVARL